MASTARPTRGRYPRLTPWGWHPGGGSRGMVVGQAKLHQLRHGIPALAAICDPLPKMGEELFHTQLIGKTQIEVGVERVKVTNQLGFGGHIFLDQRDRPGIRAGLPHRNSVESIRHDESSRALHTFPGAGLGVPSVGDFCGAGLSGSEQNVVEMYSAK